MVAICRADFDEQALAGFLQAHLDELEPTAPIESRHALDLRALKDSRIRLWVAHEGDDLVGTAALAELAADHEELKSMRTDPRRRRSGIASTMISRLLQDARARGVRRISLETGSMEYFAPARAFYRKHGFVQCPPFGGYVEDPNSTFMSLAL